MELKELFLTRQSCRNYAKKPVEREKIEKIMEQVRLAPSACNSQPWKFVVVNESENTDKVRHATQLMGVNKFTDNCGTFIVVVEEEAKLLARVAQKFKNQEFAGNDIGLAVGYMILSATELGLSTCILGWFNEKEIKEVLWIEQEKRVRLVVALGYASEDDKIREKARKPIDKIVEYK